MIIYGYLGAVVIRVFIHLILISWKSDLMSVCFLDIVRSIRVISAY